MSSFLILFLVYLNFNGHSNKCTSFLSARENDVLQWALKLKSALAMTYQRLIMLSVY